MGVEAQIGPAILHSETIEDKCAEAEELMDHFRRNDIDSLLPLGKELIQVARSTSDEKALNTSMRILGIYFIRKAKEIRGIELLKKSKNYYLKIEDWAIVSEILNEIGNAYMYLGKSEISIDWYEESLKYGKTSSDSLMAFAAMINMSQAYLGLGKYEKATELAKEYRDECLKFNRIEALTNSYSVLGKIAMEDQNYDEAVVYFKEAEKFASKIDSKILRAHAINNLGIVAYFNNDMPLCTAYFKEALQIKLDVNNPATTCEGYLNLGGIYFETKDYTNCEINYKSGLKLAQLSGLTQNESDMIDALIELYNENGDSINKTFYSKEKVRINKVLQNEKQQKDLLESEFDKDFNFSLIELGKIDSSNSNPMKLYFGALVLLLISVIVLITKRLI